MKGSERAELCGLGAGRRRVEVAVGAHLRASRAGCGRAARVMLWRLLAKYRRYEIRAKSTCTWIAVSTQLINHENPMWRLPRWFACFLGSVGLPAMQ